MSHPAHALTHSQELTDERETFSREAWRRAIEMAHRLMQHGDLQKIVLARQTALDFFGEPNPASVLEALAEETHASTVFAYRQRNAGVFLGATPERLFTLNRRHVTVDSLAGTRPRGTGEAEDNRFAEDLAGSEKDLLEQQFVTDHVVLQLQSLCDDVIIESAPRIRKLEAVQHLATIVEGTARDGTTLDQILFALHPTPATCGSPIAIARDLIAEWEPQPRGLYAGTIGWVGAQQAEFVVAIRAGLIRRDKARLFAGAGIVRASDADNEYDECEWKMLPLRRAILNQRR
jgi:isochorismate synthase